MKDHPSLPRKARSGPRTALLQDERGASVTEYVVGIGFIAVVAFVGFRAFGSRLDGKGSDQAGTVLCIPGSAGSDGAGCNGGNGAGNAGAGAAPPVVAANTPPECAKCSGPNCFVAGTPVATPSGLRAIEDIREGDDVLSMREETGEVVVEPVLATFRTLDRPVVAVYVRGLAGQSEPIEATPGHLFYTRDRGWVPAASLAASEPLVMDVLPGDPLDSVGAATDALLVDGVVAVDQRETVYNFEVGETHTYFVGADHVLVHNPIDCSNPAWHTPNNPFSTPFDSPPPSPVGGGAPVLPGAPPPPGPPPPAPAPPAPPAPTPGAAAPAVAVAPAPPTASSPASAVLDDPDTHASKFPTVVNSQALAQAAADAFDQRQYGPPHVIKNDLPSLDGQTVFLSHRVYGQLPPGVAESIVQNGSIASEYRKGGVTTVGEAQARFDQYEQSHTAGDVANDVESHKGPGAASHEGTKWVGVTADPSYLYNGFDGTKLGPNGEKIGLYVYVKQQQGDKVVQTASMQPYTRPNRWTGGPKKIFGVTTTVGPDGQPVYNDNESEHLFGGAIPPSSIVYAAWAEPKNAAHSTH